jgi:L-fucose mutarotase
VLKGIDALLTPELLKLLCEMGHGDEIAVVDANFTAHSLARAQSGREKKRVIAIPGVGLVRACSAVLSVFPLDAFVTQPIAFMHVCNTAPDYQSACQRETITLIQDMGIATNEQCQATERFAFYERVSHAYAIVQTGEMQAYANFLFKKGVIADPFRA